MSLSFLVVHNRYKERGGEDSVMEADCELLQARGHRVDRLIFDNDEIPDDPSPLAKLRLASEAVWSRPAQKRLQAALEEFQPDVVHFHNTLPQVSPAAYRVAKRHGAAVVQTLHNYRLVCPSGVVYRDGKPCESCVGQPLPVSSVLHACYRGSRVQSATVAAMLTVHRAIGTYHRDVDLYLSPSAFLKGKVVAGAGIPAEKVMVAPHFITPDPGVGAHDGDFVIYASRVTETKGIRTLLAAYERHPDGLPPLVVAHGGDLLPEVEAAAARDPRIRVPGRVSRDEAIELMGRARAIVVPSLWYENLLMTIAEGFARGLPAIASNLGSFPEMVEDGVNGLLFEPRDADDLAAKLREVREDSPRLQAMRVEARRLFVERYSEDRAYETLVTGYYRAINTAGVMKQTLQPHVI
jgi:glycosyltransferase involved in cell wall biosynthesis